jgi:hypothetical protein
VKWRFHISGPETDPLSLSIMQFLSGIILQMSQADMGPPALARLQVGVTDPTSSVVDPDPFLQNLTYLFTWCVVSNGPGRAS